MRQGLKLMVLAGSAEARAIAQACAGQGASVRALVSEAPRGANPMPVPCDLLDFRDVGAVEAALKGCDAVVDASHGFDAAMSAQGAAVAAKLGVPFISYVRPAWPVSAAQNTVEVADVAAAMARVGPGARVFSAAGWASLAACADFAGAALFLRQTTAHDRPAPYPFVTLSFGDPPFDVAHEVALFQSLRIDTLLCRNLGGAPSFPKVAAAEQLGLRVILIARPELPRGVATVHSVEDAVAWAATQ